MKTLGFVISEKENERRRAISFEGLSKIQNKNLVKNSVMLKTINILIYLHF